MKNIIRLAIPCSVLSVPVMACAVRFDYNEISIFAPNDFTADDHVDEVVDIIFDESHHVGGYIVGAGGFSHIGSTPLFSPTQSPMLALTDYQWKQ